MSKVIDEANALKDRLSKAASAINQEWQGFNVPKGYNEAIAELEDIILDFKMLSFRTTKDAPVHEEIVAIPGSYRKRTEYLTSEDYIGRIAYLMDKFIQYNSQE